MKPINFHKMLEKDKTQIDEIIQIAESMKVALWIIVAVFLAGIYVAILIIIAILQ